MKTQLLIIFSIFSFNICFSQALPNSAFEGWTHNSFPAYDDPNGWNTLNSVSGLLGAITCYKATAIADIHGGAAALKLVTKNVAGQIANGIATTGTINTTAQTIGGGIAYTGRPDSIVGYYKYTPVNNDNGFVEFQLLGAGGDTDTVGYVRFKTPSASVASYTRFSAPIVYKKTTPVVKSIWIISSSADATTHYVNSTLFIDDLQLINNTSSVVEKQKPQITVGTNPSLGNLIVRNSLLEKASITIYDITGRIILTQSISNLITSIDVSNYPMGLYIYAVTDEKNNVIKTDKLIFQK